MLDENWVLTGIDFTLCKVEWHLIEYGRIAQDRGRVKSDLLVINFTLRIQHLVNNERDVLAKMLKNLIN